ncbi:uncharacterized protein NEMAJ01_0478 [Nematocida major]|uniref:uncharacterized protein n=1 Tax=Nematocida major TaxID=1912982 RepID=UPI002007AD4E|nr:uncharacterized protein NEMAJ01_0478 [Nematocida major]KAH9385582.1 hypothetical protein NEMAJ01_0478 [Nematocida major]
MQALFCLFLLFASILASPVENTEIIGDDRLGWSLSKHIFAKTVELMPHLEDTEKKAHLKKMLDASKDASGSLRLMTNGDLYAFLSVISGNVCKSATYIETPHLRNKVIQKLLSLQIHLEERAILETGTRKDLCALSMDAISCVFQVVFQQSNNPPKTHAVFSLYNDIFYMIFTLTHEINPMINKSMLRRVLELNHLRRTCFVGMSLPDTP